MHLAKPSGTSSSSVYTAKLSRVFKQKRKRHGREEEVQTQLSDFHDEPVAVCRPLPEGEEDSITATFPDESQFFPLILLRLHEHFSDFLEVELQPQQNKTHS